ncbi:PfkB family carbohydrate kinase, partial [Mesorhizobium sp. M7A.F.Ca.CA.001.05.1.1]
PRKVADVTGAGDALAGATVAALLRGLPLRAALREGIAGATLAIESAAAVPEFTAASFAEALVLVPDAREVA